ncbi:methyltransferase domain-containing protein [Geobacter pelophilus]|uniref:Methyltransferase domain-containing protein n=1 Tax=Geoanaerobacter pelophilus TaxID=60036 RepID=A0AAW4L5T2_9BACT|nr:class I SAM-dependent methyltransferase [Geoanaerobacter pelophilus]MBT0663925.1 methyltransferase domain-containing protein [Geoanaerobacter pelophilus]
MTIDCSNHSGEILDRSNSFDVIKCEQCGYIHITPLPTEEELNKIYGEEYYTVEKPLFIERQKEDIEWWRTIFDDRYTYLESRIGEAERTILDIGCGPGFFLQRGSERGWKGVGVEPSRQASAHAQSIGCEVHNLFLQQAEKELNGKNFNVIHMSEVLEHIPNPSEICAIAERLLNPGGILCVVVPNDYNPLQKVLRRQQEYRPYWLAPPHHINYFTFADMENLLQATGFTVIHKTAMFPMELFLLMGDNYVGNDQLGRECHGKRKRLDIALSSAELQPFRLELYELMSRHEIGREMIIYAQKPVQA